MNIFCLDLSQKSAEVIISVAFGVMMMKQLTRQRLLTTLNNYMAQGDERRSLQSAPKASLLRPLAKLLLAKKIVVLSEGATLQNVKRQDVKVNGTFVSHLVLHCHFALSIQTFSVHVILIRITF